ncbi:MAG: hypothetical protein CMI76_01675 [Candidatus Pelagibacter sp.]|nr:hypothetical protein [Candidatus Pelagibacter sp.]|tara:strand:+ start:1850 stop:2773 length:924 start_codon:yes stop_codon:yes gene_type:complete
MKIYLNKAGENWIVDRFYSEWNDFNSSTTSNFIFNSDIIWLIAPWTWRKINKNNLSRKKVVCTIHHIDESKFDEKQKKEFYERDKYVDFYHVISEKTFKQLVKLTDKKIFEIPFWVNQNIWFQLDNKTALRKKYNIDKNSFLVGSFQRDTEGHDLKSPKLSKGPDQFLKIVRKLCDEKKDLTVLLSGKRRQYLISELNNFKIPFYYLEMTDHKTLNELYNILDLYIVASRVEGGPQSILEAAATKTPLISTNVGIAEKILNSSSIYNMENFMEAEPDIEYSYSNVKKYFVPEAFKSFYDMFEFVSEN